MSLHGKEISSVKFSRKQEKTTPLGCGLLCLILFSTSVHSPPDRARKLRDFPTG